MKKDDVKNIIIHALHVNESDIKDIRPAGGMTNFNFETTINNKKYIIRIPGRGTDELINRQTEFKNLTFATSLGINPEFIYFDVDSGIKITRKINRAITLTPALVRKPHIKKAVIQLFQKLHQAETMMENDFQLFALMKHYEDLVKRKKASIWNQYELMIPVLQELISYYQSDDGIKKVPCHIDPIYTNFMIDPQGTLFLIDWEYSGMFDPFWDLTAFSLECGFTEQEEQQFLVAYFQRNLTEKELQRILLLKIFQDYLWSLWTFYKESLGSEFGSYGTLRLNRAKENISLFYKKYD